MNNEIPLYPIRYKVIGPPPSLDVKDKVSADPETLWSEAFVCPKCGELWARIYGLKDWVASTRLCQYCGGGSLINWSFDEYYLLSLPIELLKYEVMIWQVPEEQSTNQLTLPL